MKYLFLILAPCFLFADGWYKDGVYYDDLVYRGETPNLLKVGINVDGDTTNKIISIDEKTVKIEREYKVKDTLIFKR